MTLDDHARAVLATLVAEGRRRERRTYAPGPGATLVRDGVTGVDFGANDYLGLARDPRLVAAATRALESAGVGAGGSQLVHGHTAAHAALEDALLRWLAAPAVVTFGSGYAGNVGVLSALADRDTIVFSDALNHASLIDGCRLSRAEIVIYPHGDVAALADRLAQASSSRRRLVVSESLFSMDGDVVDVAGLATVCQRLGAALVLDEAHALGVWGPAGRGVAAAVGVQPDVLLGTFGKALGGAGAFACASPAVVELLWHRARSLVFSTALPPVVLAAVATAVEIVAGAEGEARRARLRAHATALRGALAARAGGSAESPIVPIRIGDDRTAVEVSAALATRALWVPAIRPPTVPAGTARLRVSLSAAHTDAQVAALAQALTGSPGDPSA